MGRTLGSQANCKECAVLSAPEDQRTIDLRDYKTEISQPLINKDLYRDMEAGPMSGIYIYIYIYIII